MLASSAKGIGQGEPGLIEFPKRLKILVVEDSFCDYDAVARALRKMECFEAQTVRAKTIEAARRAVAEQDFDIFLIDYNLGDDSGARFLQEIGGRTGRGVPILLTGMLDRDVHEIALRAGAIGCISKSDLSPSLLETTLRSALYTHRLELELSGIVWMAANAGSGPALAQLLQSVAIKMPWLARSRPPKVA